MNMKGLCWLKNELTFLEQKIAGMNSSWGEIFFHVYMYSYVYIFEKMNYIHSILPNHRANLFARNTFGRFNRHSPLSIMLKKILHFFERLILSRGEHPFSFSTLWNCLHQNLSRGLKLNSIKIFSKIQSSSLLALTPNVSKADFISNSLASVEFYLFFY